MRANAIRAVDRGCWLVRIRLHPNGFRASASVGGFAGAGAEPGELQLVSIAAIASCSVTDKLASYQVADRELMPSVQHRRSKYLNSTGRRTRTSRPATEAF